MAQKYKAERIGGELIIKPNVKKDKQGNVTVQVPSMSTIARAKKKFKQDKK